MRIPFTNIELFTKKVVNMAESMDMPLTDERNIMGAIPYEQTLTRQKQDIGRWNNAIIAAESIHFPVRAELLRLYKETTLDPHLTALITTRKNALLGGSYIVVDKDGVKDDIKTSLISKKWFHDFIDLSLDSIYYGYSLIQFDDLKSTPEGPEFKGVSLVPRQYVRQEKHLVVPTPYGQFGEDYMDEPWADWVIGIGDPRDLGLLAKAAPIVLWKKGFMISWAIYSEIFGQPIRVGKMNKRDEKTFQSMVNFLKNMGNAPYAVINKDDEIQLLEGSKGGEGVFSNGIDQMNKELSKLILGQTGTTDEKSFSGSANVHERIMHQYNEADETLLEFIIQYQLVPLLNRHGFGLEGFRICVEEDDKLSLTERSKIDLELLKFYDIPCEYIEMTYGTPVVDSIKPNIPTNIQNKLDEFYGE